MIAVIFIISALLYSTNALHLELSALSRIIIPYVHRDGNSLQSRREQNLPTKCMPQSVNKHALIAVSISALLMLASPQLSHAGPPESNVIGGPIIYKSGKNPFPPASKDSTAGTKKDINFLRCMSNCKSQCQLPGEGLVKTDCVQDCQDQCCDSYEQCSYKIKINTNNAI